MKGTMEESRIRVANPEPSPGLRLSFTQEEKGKEPEMMNSQGHELSTDKRLVLERWLSH